MGQPRLNLSNVHCLLADRDQFTRGLIAQMLRGFGLRAIAMATDGAGAREAILKDHPDICLIEGALPDITAPELVTWIRQQPAPLRFTPIVVLAGYTQLKLISKVRDSGANLVIRKPVSPRTLFDRLMWVSSVQRPFIETDVFLGPDRRFHSTPPPDGQRKRATDASNEASA